MFRKRGHELANLPKFLGERGCGCGCGGGGGGGGGGAAAAAAAAAIVEVSILELAVAAAPPVGQSVGELVGSVPTLPASLS